MTEWTKIDGIEMTQEDAAIYLRRHCLDQAARALCGMSAAMILDAAKQFESYVIGANQNTRASGTKKRR